MRFVGLLVTLLVVVVFAALVGALKFLQPLYLAAVVLAAFGATLVAYAPADFFASFAAWGSPAGTRSRDEYARWARLHDAARKAAVAAGLVATLLGTLAVLAGGAPPSVVDFAQALSGLVFGGLWGGLVHAPLARWFEEQAK